MSDGLCTRGMPRPSPFSQLWKRACDAVTPAQGDGMPYGCTASQPFYGSLKGKPRRHPTVKWRYGPFPWRRNSRREICYMVLYGGVWSLERGEKGGRAKRTLLQTRERNTQRLRRISRAAITMATMATAPMSIQRFCSSFPGISSSPDGFSSTMKLRGAVADCTVP